MHIAKFRTICFELLHFCVACGNLSHERLPRTLHPRCRPWLVGAGVYSRQSLTESGVSSLFAEGQAHTDHCKQQYRLILSGAGLLPSPAAQFIAFFHCTIPLACDSISAVDPAWHTPLISTTLSHPQHHFPYCTWPHQHQRWQENGKYISN